MDQLMVDVSFAKRRVFEAQPSDSTSGSYRLVGKPKPMPWSCRASSLRDRGR